MRDRLIDFSTGKYILGPTGDASPVGVLDGVAQACNVAINTWLGTYPLDSAVGVSYLQNIFVKNPNLQNIRSILTKVLKSVSGVAEVTGLTCFIANRVLTVDFTVRTSDGSVTGTATAGV